MAVLRPKGSIAAAYVHTCPEALFLERQSGVGSGGLPKVGRPSSTTSSPRPSWPMSPCPMTNTLPEGTVGSEEPEGVSTSWSIACSVKE
eukprot:3809700-Rhodomonas_salina.3